ncbi:hypothetical protein CAPTEDRAFT_51446, partial [Capitella teleta]
VSLVIANRPDAAGLAWAKEQGLPTLLIDHKQFSDRLSFEQALLEALDREKIELVVLAGFMRLLSAEFVARFPKRIINIHPSLLPAYKGLDTHKRVLEAGDKYHGCTVHIVTEALDDGPILAQSKLEVYAGDTPESLAERLLPLEH